MAGMQNISVGVQFLRLKKISTRIITKKKGYKRYATSHFKYITTDKLAVLICIYLFAN